MRLALLGVVLGALLLSGCGTSGADSLGNDGPPGVTDDALVGLVYWDETGFSSGFPALLGYGDPPAEVLETLATIRADGEDRYLPYLLDLATAPTPIQITVLTILREQLPPTDSAIYGWFEERGSLTAGDDSATYLTFKQRFIGGIEEAMGEFLDPTQARAISAQEILWGGVFKDGIPPLDEPAFVTAEAASWANADDLVIGVAIDGDVRAYPRRIIEWHEIVNDTVAGRPVTLAFCTLCGSAILYDGTVGDDVYRFGTSGLLYRSNKLMYDRGTGTLWEQFTGEPVWGTLVATGKRLNVLPVVHTTYAAWVAEHPETLVLDIKTGFQRDYSPGAAYGEYSASSNLLFPAPIRSGPLESKDVVYVVRIDDIFAAYPMTTLAERGLVQDTVGATLVVVLRTADGSGGRAYDAGDHEFTAADLEAGVVTDGDGGRWRITEEELIGPDGDQLARLPGHNAFWFSIVNHSTEYQLYE